MINTISLFDDPIKAMTDSDRRYDTGSARACAEFARDRHYYFSPDYDRRVGRVWLLQDLDHMDYSIAEKRRALAQSIKDRDCNWIAYYRALIYCWSAKRRMIIYLRDQLGLAD